MTKKDAVPATAKRTAPAMKAEMVGEREAQLTVSGDMERFDAATGGGAVAEGLLRQLSNLTMRGGQFNNDAANFALGFVDAMKPRDAAEALLCTQMAAIHQATVMLAKRLNHADSLPHQDSAERALNKLARTFAAQMDTLKRYRSKGEQTMRVEHVTVAEGGQAIIGNVDARGRGREEK